MDQINIGRPSEPVLNPPRNGADVDLRQWMREVERRLQILESQAGTS